MFLEDFDYFLPPELIAQRPPLKRDGGRLLLLRRETGQISHHQVIDLPELLPPNALVLFNNSRVIPARLHAKRKTGGQVELLLMERLAFEHTSQGVKERWLSMSHSSKKLHPQEQLILLSPPRESATNVESSTQLLIENVSQKGRLELSWTGPTSIVAHGNMPLPPYIERPDDENDADRYQTVYSRPEGSVAAPTAGLHFTDELLARLDRNGLERHSITLHVGPGTFVPVRTERIEDHQMEEERFEISEETMAAIKKAKTQNRPIVAIGTTTVRTIESSDGNSGAGRTKLFITPGYSFKYIDGMMTNFHLPKSTLLMLVSALAGRENILKAYAAAVREKYRFYSYGDAMLIL